MKKILNKLIEASNKIENSRKPKASYVSLSISYIQEQADKYKVSFDDMVKIIENNLNLEVNE